MTELKVFYDGDSSYAAVDVADATAQWEEINGCKWKAEHDDDDPWEVWVERPLDAFTTVTFDYTDDMLKAAPVGAVIAMNDGGQGGKVRATWRAWAEKTGRGMICSENW